MSSELFDEPQGVGDRLDDLLVRLEDWAARSRPVVIAAIVVVLAIAVAGWSLRRPASGGPVDELIPRAEAAPATSGSVPPVSPSASDAEPSDSAAGVAVGGGVGEGGEGAGDAVAGEPAELIVHVVGEVRRPGLVRLAPGARLSDAVEAAGGVVDGADVERLNLAEPVVDGMQIRVPAADEDPPAGGGVGPTTAADEPLVRLPTTVATGSASTPPPVVDLNRATEVELQALPGIGPALAGRIVAWRSDNGPFVTVDDLEAVPGIGPATLDRLRDLVIV